MNQSIMIQEIYESLFSYIQSHSALKLSVGDKELLQDIYQPRTLKRNQFFLREGDVCKYMAFVVKGAMCLYTIDAKGHEHVLRFAVENWWMGDYESFAKLIPSQFYIIATEQAALLVLSYEQMRELVDKVPAYAEMIRILDKRVLIATNRRIHGAISLTAEERLARLQQDYPEFLKRFTRNMIASYLGMTPETLSRIKRKQLKMK